MAGRHRGWSGSGERVEVTLRIPVALKAHLMDLALGHGRSLNEEILVHLMPSGERRRAMRRELMGLEPKSADDPRTDSEIVTEMEGVYRRWEVSPDATCGEIAASVDALTDARVEEAMGQVEWLNPGGWPKVSR